MPGRPPDPVMPQLRPTSGARLAVYSCYLGAHEPFNPDATGVAGQGYDRFVFTDHDDLPTTATLVPLADRGEGPAILSRLPKLCPHRIFSGYDWVIYLDNNARFLLDPARILRRVRKEHPDAPQGPICSGTADAIVPGTRLTNACVWAT